MSPGRQTRMTGAAVAFTAAAVSFALGLGGRSGSWLVAMVMSLVFLTVGFFIVSAWSRKD